MGTSTQENFKRKLVGFGVLLIFFLFVVIGMGVMKSVAQTGQASMQEPVSVEENQGDTARHDDPGVVKYAFLAAAIAVGVGSLGAGAAVGYVGAAAMGAIGEKPELAGRALIFVGLAEGIAIYGLIIAIMILGKV